MHPASFPLFAALALAALLPAQNTAQSDAASDPPAPTRAVLVTGASSGIGRATAERLAREGFHVYAGARKDADLAALDALDNVEAVRLDVTDTDQIAAAVAQVSRGGRGLYGLINNAGVLVMAPLTEVTEADLDFQMDVNVRGPYRVTKAFAPLLVESKGRVLTTGSISGFVTWPMGGPYTMSKHAVEAYTDCLAAELGPLGVHVGVVEPGNFRSAILANMVDRMKDRGYCGKGSLFEGQLDRILDGDASRAEHASPDAVAAVFVEALTAERPPRRHMVTPNAREAEMTLRAALGRAVELNAASSHPISDDELHALLDEALARR
ncbi:MAG: SDR family oxidoreductase [Planctomycetota bacterium]